jgi:methionyl-tRNA formyltransferase
LREAQPAVAQAASRLGIKVFQPRAMRSEATAQRLKDASPEAIVVEAYGRILPASILGIPPLGCLNVHLSLLPRHRGAAPISGALLAGDPVTGVSIMVMDEGLDTGPVLAQQSIPIEDADDQVNLTPRLAALGAELLVETLPRWQRRELEPIPQDERLATLTRPTARADATLVWDRPGIALWRTIRAFAEWPQGHTWWDGKLLRILRADFDPTDSGDPGEVRPLDPGRPRRVSIGTGKGVVIPRMVGLEGKKTVPIEAFLQGYPGFVGAHLGRGDEDEAVTPNATG